MFIQSFVIASQNEMRRSNLYNRPACRQAGIATSLTLLAMTIVAVLKQILLYLGDFYIRHLGSESPGFPVPDFAFKPAHGELLAFILPDNFCFNHNAFDKGCPDSCFFVICYQQYLRYVNHIPDISRKMWNGNCLSGRYDKLFSTALNNYKHGSYSIPFLLDPPDGGSV